MKKFKYLILNVIIVLSLLFYLGGCSSGGGGGSDGDDGLTYSGLTSQAEISEENAEDMSGGAFGSGLIGDGMMGFSSLDRSSDEHSVGEFRTAKIPQILSDSLYLMDFTAPSKGAAQAALETVEETVDDDCGSGTLTYSMRMNDLSDTFSGSFTFSDYCNGGTTINGRVRFEGSIKNLDPLEFDDVLLTFETLSGAGLTLDGDIEIDFKDSADEVTFNAYGQDPGSGKVYWIENYNLTFEEDTNGNENFVRIRILSGKFYHPDYGYVSLATLEEDPFEMYEGDEFPDSGTLVVTGANNSKAKIKALDHATCEIEADIDGIEGYEWKSEIMYWDEI